MTQIPEVGSIWVSKTISNYVVEVLFADDVSVYFRLANSDDTDTYNTRGELPTRELADYFKPKPRMITHRIWVCLYRNGAAMTWAAHEKALQLARDFPDIIAETRCIEWEVEE